MAVGGPDRAGVSTLVAAGDGDLLFRGGGVGDLGEVNGSCCGAAEGPGDGGAIGRKGDRAGCGDPMASRGSLLPGLPLRWAVACGVVGRSGRGALSHQGGSKKRKNQAESVVEAYGTACS